VVAGRIGWHVVFSASVMLSLSTVRAFVSASAVSAMVVIVARPLIVLLLLVPVVAVVALIVVVVFFFSSGSLSSASCWVRTVVGCWGG
jgi:hypothetical protein